ncbi:MAG: phosphate/phosphite/phosphonate ABC transporter substrate-binding protein [Candidatus Sumerlaeota bacterium]|nr:phosphate/phosphite/phosphonate ABC transporter substrate-binding protein [Candidatus Sumerlaeota bacterium]
MRLPVFITSLAAVMLMVAGCKEPPVGSKARPFTMYFVPSTEGQGISLNANSLAAYMEKKLTIVMNGGKDKFYVKSAVPTNYITVIEAFGTQKADFAALTVYSYILAHDVKKYDAQMVLSVIRGKDERSYQGEIIAHKDSGIKKLEDLKGKKFAFVDPASTSGYIMPLKLLKEKGVVLGGTIFAQRHDNVVTMIYQKQVDAGACYYGPPAVIKQPDGSEKTIIRDARDKVRTQFPDVEDKVRIIALTEEIPNDPWVLRGKIFDNAAKNEALKKAVIEGLLEYAQTPEGKNTLDGLSNVTGLFEANDSAYNGIRKAVKDADMDLEAVLKKKK